LYLRQSVGKTEEDFQVDDALIDCAARKQSQSHIESREQQLAIIGLFSCMFCFFSFDAKYNNNNNSNNSNSNNLYYKIWDVVKHSLIGQL